MFRIGNKELENNILLAPMAGVTDKAFRLITKPFGPALMYTEMVSGKGLFHGSRKTAALLETDDAERPTAVQIFGHEPDVMAKIAYEALGFGAEILDINMGCPAPKITGSGDGSALSKNPRLAGEIISAVCREVSVPVTVKIRSGWDSESQNAVEMAKIAEQNGASAVCVHGRTREQFYSGKADLGIIRDVCRAVSIPVIGNGDISDGKSAETMLRSADCAAIMIGRAAQGNPWVFSRVREYLRTGSEPEPPSIEERADIMEKHLSLLLRFKGEVRGILEARKHMAWYVKGLPGGARLREIINSSCSESDMRRAIDIFRSGKIPEQL